MKQHFIPVFCSAAFLIFLLSACETQRGDNFPPDSYIDTDPEVSTPVNVNTEPAAEDDTVFIVPKDNLPKEQAGKTEPTTVITIDPVETTSTSTQPEATTTPNDGSVVYKVRKNDSLWSIGMTYGVSVDELAKANNLDKNKPLQINQTLIIPADAKNAVDKPIPAKSTPTKTTTTKKPATTQTTSKPKSSTTTVKPIPAKVQPKEGESTYVVKAGDSLSVIAAHYKVKTATLAKRNNITDLNNIRVGQTLVIPVADAAASTSSNTTKATTNTKSTTKTPTKTDDTKATTTKTDDTKSTAKSTDTVTDNSTKTTKTVEQPETKKTDSEAAVNDYITLPVSIDKGITLEKFLQDNKLDLETFRKINPELSNLSTSDMIPAGTQVNFILFR